MFGKLPEAPKTTICMTTNKVLKNYLRVAFPNHQLFVNLNKELIPNVLGPLYSSVLFLPSRYEGFSLSLIEAMSQGLVPVSYPVGVAPEILQNGYNGFLVSDQNEALARIRELFAGNEARERMAMAAKLTAEQFRSERIAGRLVVLYKNLRTQNRASRKERSR